MPELRCAISRSLQDALEARRARTGETLDHIVMAALADALQVDHATLFQISTTGALVQGVTGEAITVAELSRHGDFGLGTFAGLDGEMVVLDGATYRVGEDGPALAPADAQVPFAVITHFLPQRQVTLEAVASLADLQAQLDLERGSDNEFFAVRIEGRFEAVRTRTVGRADSPTEGPATLVEAAAGQTLFAFEQVEGVLVGFWTPTYLQTVNVVGWHLHFLSADRRGGGHLLACSGRNLKAALQPLADFRMAIPETPAFLQADLSSDMRQALEQAEKQG
ncbi:acetolactate decarboxylase [Synechococcus sp. CCY 9618]|uniref:acetolactate decarboxylase n=1 Tax=Synechococcus sp. CCY 9618 TaxID=2815602 RepID=UPI001C21D8D2|nr:acetolactate decarboxylase [Synechococcus sp. CCY 9618]